MRTVLAALLFCACAGSAGAQEAELRHRFYISSDELREADLRAVATALVARIRRECDEAGEIVGAAPLAGGYEFVVMVPPEALDSIAREGLRNQHETTTSGGDARPMARYEAEQELAMLRLPYDARGRALLPKYAILSARGPKMGSFRLPTRYGTVALVLAPAAAARATWTYADSLDFSRTAGLFEPGGPGNPVLPRTVSYRRRAGDENMCGNYCEAQIWGPVGLSDVAYAMIPSSAPIPPALLRAGLTVYRYAETVSSSERTALFVRGEKAAGPAAPAAEAAPPSPAEEGLRRGREASALEPEALVAAVGEAVGLERARLVGELASRPLSPRVRAALEKLSRSDDPVERELALAGLAAEPWADFKRRLIAGLRDQSPVVAIEAVALAAERRGDPDVARALNDLLAFASRQAREPRTASDFAPLVEWLHRLGKKRLCD